MGRAKGWRCEVGIFCSRVGKMGVKSGGSDIGRKSGNIKVLRMRFSISRNVPTSARSVLRTFPASHEPYSEKSENQTKNVNPNKSRKNRKPIKSPISPSLFPPISPLKAPIGIHLTFLCRSEGSHRMGYFIPGRDGGGLVAGNSSVS